MFTISKNIARFFCTVKNADALKTNSKGIPPIRYDAVNECLRKVGKFAEQNNSLVHMPRIGCGLAGGKWEDIEPLIREELSSRGIKTIVYDFE